MEEFAFAELLGELNGGDEDHHAAHQDGGTDGSVLAAGPPAQERESVHGRNGVRIVVLGELIDGHRSELDEQESAPHALGAFLVPVLQAEAEFREPENPLNPPS